MSYAKAYKTKYRKKHGGNVAIRLASVLFGLVLITTWMTGGLLAKYVAADSDEDSARVAAFVFNTATMKENGTEQVIIPLTDICNPGDQLIYSIEVSNHRSNIVSEVDESYAITISKQGSMPLQCTLIKEDDSKHAVKTQQDKICAEKDEIKSTSIESNDSLLPAGTREIHKYTLLVEWPENYSDVIYASRNAIGKVEIIVNAQQED